MNQFSNANYNLEERTARFGEAVIKFCRDIEPDIVSRPIIQQLVRSSTSVGANYMEANAASSRKDFRNKIFICKKEVQETKHWLRMIAQCISAESVELANLRREGQELTLIFQKITNSLKNIP